MKCRACKCDDLHRVLSLGRHYLPDFTEPGELRRDIAWPLNLELCPDCGLLQLETTTPRDRLYHERYGFRSGVNEAIRRDLADIVNYARCWHPKARSWLDIASNDGTLLSFVPPEITRVGVDPLKHLAPLARQHADRIITDYFRPGLVEPHSMDIVTSVSMFYDLDDPRALIAAVSNAMSPHGIWVIQQNYAADMIAANAVDNICHEHVTYFTVRPLKLLLESAGLQIIDVTYSPVNGGCFRTLVTYAHERRPNASVDYALSYEKISNLDRPERWRAWGEQVTEELDKTRRWLHQMQSEGERVYLYGASTRGGTILQMINAGPDLLPFAVERQEAKVGKVMSATGIPIISEKQMRAEPPDALLVSPWFFRDVFIQREAEYLKNGGLMVFPLPVFDIVAAP